MSELMIRQEDLILKPDDDAPVVIRDRQFLGHEHCYCLLTPSGQELHVRTASSTFLPYRNKGTFIGCRESSTGYPATGLL